MQGVNSEQRGHKRAPPNRTSHLLEHEKQQDHGNRMKKYVSKMMPACLQPIELAVQHVCDCRQRMPVLSMDMTECPGNTSHVKAAGDFRILINITRVIIVTKSCRSV